MTGIRTLTLLIAVGIGAAAEASGQAPVKRPLDHDVYEVWDTIGAPALSRDGAWALYSVLRYDRDGELRVRATAGETEHVVARGSSARFAADSRTVVFLIRPSQDSLRNGGSRKGSGAEPADTLGVLDLRSGRIDRVGGVKSFALPEAAGGRVAYLLARADTAAKASSERSGERRGNGAGTLVLRNLETGAETRYDDVVEYIFTEDGRRLAYAVSTADGAGDGVYVVDVASGGVTPVLTGKGAYRKLAWDEAGGQLAFLTTRDDAESKAASHAVYVWRVGAREATKVAAEGSAGIPAGWWIPEHGTLRFSPDGRRLYFGTAPRPEPESEGGDPTGGVRVDIWHWQDPQIQPMQLRRAAQERRRTYLAMADLRRGRVIQLADEKVPQVVVGAEGAADVAIGSAPGPYEHMNWESPSYADWYLIDVRTGERERILVETQARVLLSPGAKFAYWFDPRELAWFAMELKSRRIANLTGAIPYAFHDETHDTPQLPGPYGAAGWTEGDRLLIVYDRHDLWALDPTGKGSPRNITEGVGRRENLRFRYIRLDRDENAIAENAPLLLSAFHYRTKEDGFWRDRVAGAATPERLVMMDRSFSRPIKAEDADVLLYSRQSFVEFPDLWVADLDFSSPRKITALNPQQAEYRWGTAELVEWTSTDGIPLQGILYKPEDFDPSKKYPMVVYFYETMSDLLHAHYAPVPHRSRINPTFFVSRGYLVFIPDIVYRTGYPGESAMNAVMPGVLALIARGYVDEANIGLQGHSWGGYQIAYMVTKTRLFKAAAAGAPVANMTSAYGGIRWETGMSRQFQYERTQSRIGAPLWERPIQYFENSPLFWLDKVETPLLVLHNDEDGAVPWYQGIELYMGLRRLGKPVWLVNYNGEPHWPTTAANKRDWNIRLQQFFDHYLKGEPAPVWLAEGIPAVKKGRTLGLEPAEAPRPATDGAQP
jgi:dipeptidyl aminopeptidase/acylaminoacyl peptidase